MRQGDREAAAPDADILRDPRGEFVEVLKPSPQAEDGEGRAADVQLGADRLEVVAQGPAPWSNSAEAAFSIG